MFRYFMCGLIFWSLAALALAQAPEIEWEKTFGDVDADYAYSVAEIEGVGFVVAGSYAPATYEHDMYVVKTDMGGNTLWEETIGGEENDYVRTVLVMDDDGILICGPEQSFPPEGTDIYVLKLNQIGDTVWSKIYGYEFSGESPMGMCHLLDGNYMIAAYGLGVDEWYIWKIDPNGAVLNEVTIACSRNLKDITATSDSGAMLVGDGLFLLKLGINGDSLWSKVHGNSTGRAVVQLDDGGYAAVGEKSYYNKGDDFRLLRLDPDGELLWEKNYGNEYDEFATSIKKTSDGGLVMTGYMYPPSGTEDRQVWVVRTDADGDTLWTLAFGGEMGEIAHCIEPTSDGGYIVAGETYSYGAGSLDMYLVKLGPDTAVITDVAEYDDVSLPTYDLLQNYPNPFNPITRIEFTLPTRSDVDLSIYNVLGQKIKTLVNDSRKAGKHSAEWNGTDADGNMVSSGIYFYRLKAGDIVQSKKMILLK